MLLLGKYDSVLKTHIDQCINQSSKNHASKPTGKIGRGNFVSMFSKTTLNKILIVIGKLIRSEISHQINLAKMFSLQIDTTQDISCKDQCSIITRYVYKNSVHERLLSVVHCRDSTGRGLKELVVKLLQESKIKIKKCVGSAEDGAANMQGQYEGFTAYLNLESPLMIHVWCYAHVLNLVMIDVTSCTVSSQSLFGLLNTTAVFFRDSYKRMDIWEALLSPGDHRRLNLAGQTRWWAKDAALTKIFGPTDAKDKSLYITLIEALEKIENDSAAKPAARADAKACKEAFLKYETILVAFIFRFIFDRTTCLSNYLQTEGLDIMKAFSMVQKTIKELKALREKFYTIKETADQFVVWANQALEKKDLESEVQNTLPTKRIRRKKSMPGEKAVDEIINNAEDAFRINTFFVIVDKVVTCLGNRFSEFDRKLYADLAWLDPRSFDDINSGKLKAPAMEELSKKLAAFNPSVTSHELRTELINLASKWNVLKTSPLDDYYVSFNDDDDIDPDVFPDDEDDDNSLVFQEQSEKNLEKSNDETNSSKKNPKVPDEDAKESENSNETGKHKSCGKCAICCFRLLNKYNLSAKAFPFTSLAFQYMLTLSFTQVACERSFSILKFIKNRLRSSMGQDKLNTFMLMSSEKDILKDISVEMIINELIESSSTFRDLLLC